MNKILAVLYIILLASILASIYGIIHDHLTYTISPEYYTKFKFYQFGIATMADEAIFPNTRFYVSIVGIMATWWVGLLAGIVLALVGLIRTNVRTMFWVTIQAMFLTIVIALGAGLIGLVYGKLYLSEVGVDWYLPADLIDVKNFIAVGSMHTFSYLGGLFGLIVGVVYSIKKKSHA